MSPEPEKSRRRALSSFADQQRDDDFEEANLSEHEEETGGGIPKKNECDRYSDLRASHSGS